MFKSKKAVALFFAVFLFTAINAYSFEVHIEYDWWDTTKQVIPPPSKEWASCGACHASFGVAGDLHKTLRRFCEDCHLLGRKGPFEHQDKFLIRSQNYSAPMVYNHIINASNDEIQYVYSTPLIEVQDQSGVYNGAAASSCVGWNPVTGEGTCHGISSQSKVDGYFAFNLSRESSRESPYRFGVDSTNLPSGLDCLYCHSQTNQDILTAWGQPNQVDSSHFNSTENIDCYECHVTEGITLTSFHRMGVEPEVIYLVVTTTTTTTTTTSTTTSTSTTTTTTTTSTTTLIVTEPPTTQPPTTTPLTQTPIPVSTQAFPFNTLYLAIGAAVLILLAVVVLILRRRRQGEEQDK